MGAITSTCTFLLSPSPEKEQHILGGLHKCQETEFILEVVGERHDKEHGGSSSAWTFGGTEMARAKGADRSISQESRWTPRHPENYFSRMCTYSVDREVVRPSSSPIPSPRSPPKIYHHYFRLPGTTVILAPQISLFFKAPLE